MAITTAQIHQAANQINKDGKRPTLAGVRAILGGGSFSTIQEAMKTWKSADDLNEIEATEVPEEITSAIEPMIAKVWELAEQIAGHKFDQKRNDHKRELFELMESRDDAIAAADEQQQLNKDAEQIILQKNSAIKVLSNLDELQRAEIAQLKAKNAELNASLTAEMSLTMELRKTIETLQTTLTHLKPIAIKPAPKKA